jgi:hypothetical protein
MQWALADRFVDEVIELYGSREQAERALEAVLQDEPDWEGMMEVIPMPPRTRAASWRWTPQARHHGRYVPRCKRDAFDR